MTDAHAHPGTNEETRIRIEKGVRTMLCGTDPASSAEVLRLAGCNSLFTPCCALHPWKAAAHKPEDMLPYLKQCPVVGETGLDSVWCETPMRAQMDALLWNLNYAERARKPVVLHTKGQEREIARILRNYTVPKVVHWYSCEEPPYDYLDQDCYFTIGPDVQVHDDVRSLITLVPFSRLLVETDGLGAVSWALGRRVRAMELPDVLKASLNFIAAQRRIAPVEAEAMVDQNYDMLLASIPCE
jgi:TatD DNase family protein